MISKYLEVSMKASDAMLAAKRRVASLGDLCAAGTGFVVGTCEGALRLCGSLLLVPGWEADALG